MEVLQHLAIAAHSERSAGLDVEVSFLDGFDDCTEPKMRYCCSVPVVSGEKGDREESRLIIRRCRVC